MTIFFTKMPLFYQASLIVPDFSIFVYGSSCNYLFSGLILPSFSICFLASHSASGMQINGKRKQRIENEAKQEIIT